MPIRESAGRKRFAMARTLTLEKMKECRWVKPSLVCQVEFVEGTDAMHLRHCKFVAMRDDKRSRDVVREA